MVMICPYCDIEINEKLIEAEDGCCPECGALITPNTVINEDDDEYYDEDEFGDEEDDDYGTGLGGGRDDFGDFDDDLDGGNEDDY